MAYYCLLAILYVNLMYLPRDALGDTEILYIEMPGTTGSPTANTTLMPSDSYNCTSQYSCSSCSQVRICSTCPGGTYRQVSLVNCSGLTPYCKEDSGTCTSIMPDKCAPLSQNFMCMRESGYFPDAKNCSQYHICSNFTSYNFSCYGGTIFNSRTGECERTDCYKFNCVSKTGVKVPYGTNKNVFAYCVYGLVWFIDRCPINYELNEATQNCEPVCKDEGYIEDITDSTKFYICYKKLVVRGVSTFTLTRKQCPESTEFDLEYSNCVKSDTISFPHKKMGEINHFPVFV